VPGARHSVALMNAARSAALPALFDVLQSKKITL
jgi:hypothetical protein